MTAGYDRAFPSGYAAAISVELSDSHIEQIRKLVNLLMVFSMLLSIISPIYAPMSFALPSYAFFDGSTAPAVQPVAAQPARTAPDVSLPTAPVARDFTAVAPQPQPVYGAGAALGAALAPAWFAAPAAPPQSAVDAAALGTALTPVWLAEAPAAPALAPLAAPWWRDPAAATLRAADIRALAPVADADANSVNVNSADAIGADLRAPAVSTAPQPDSEVIQPELGSAIAPAWLSAASAAPVAADLRSELFLPNWAPLAFAAGICAANSDFSWTTSAPISMTLGNNTAVYTFTAVIANNSITPTGPLTYAIQLPPNFTFVSGSATAVSSVSGTLTLVQAGSNTTGTITLRASTTPVSNTLMPGGVVTLTYQLRGGPNGPPNPDILVNVITGDETNLNCTLNNPVNTNFCPLAGELALAITPPPFIVSYGNTVGDLYTVTLRNMGNFTMTDVSFLVDPSPGFYFKAGTPVVGVHSVYGSLTFTQPAVDTASGEPFVLRVATPFPANSVANSETITMVMRIATTNDPKSGQPLIVTARSGKEGAELACTTTRENIATGRGHLYVRKTVAPTTAAVGDVVTFTIYLDNTGLGSLYDATFTDTMGSGLQRLFGEMVPTGIAPNATYTVLHSAVITSCVDTNNRVDAWWPVGNVNNTGTITDPVTAFAAVRVSNPLPNVSISATLPIVGYCPTVPFTVDVPLTVTNSGAGPAANFTLTPADIDDTLSFTFSTASPGWVQGTNVFSYTENDGLLAAGETVHLTLTLHYTPTTVCTGAAGSFRVTPSYSDACFPLIRTTGTAASFDLTALNVPSLNVLKESSIDADRLEVVQPGDTVYFTVTVFGDSGSILTDTQVFITDTLPPSLVAAGLITVTPPAVRDGNRVFYTPTITTEPTYAFTMFVQATYPDTDFCTDGVVEYNTVDARSDACPTCLRDSDQTALVYLDPDPENSPGFMRGDPLRLDQCRTIDRQTMVISVTSPITWAGAVYNDPLGGGGVGPVEIVPGSVRVFVNGVERTLDVTITTAPSLTIALDNIGTVSQTALISVTYQVAAPVTAQPGSVWYNVTFQSGGRNAGVCGVVRRAPVNLAISGNELNLDLLAPDVLQSCAVNNVTIDLYRDNSYVPYWDEGFFIENVTNQQVATATVSAPAQLTLEKSVTPAAATPDQTVIYAITATNSGPNAAADVVISDTLPVSLTVLAVSSSAGGCTSLPCTIGDLAANSSAVVYVVARVVQTTSGNIENTAVVTTTTALAAGSDLDASVLLPVTAAADVAVEKSAPITAATGDRITYTLVAVNHGPA